MYKRPKPQEDEEEIITQEKEFLASQQHHQFVPAAKVVRIKKKDDEDKTTTKITEMDKGTELEEPNEIVIQNSIIERSFDISKLMEFPNVKQSIPSVKSIGKGKSLFANKGLILPKSSFKSSAGKSLFAQMFDTNSNQPVTANPSFSGDGETTTFARSSSSGKPIIGDLIHPLLTGMTQADIMEEQKKLVESLDPRLVEFVRSRQIKKQSVMVDEQQKSPAYEIDRPASHSTSDVDMKNVGKMAMSPNIEESDLPINPHSVKNFPGMGNLETDKLEWTGVVKENRTTFDKLGEGETARFGFDGMLLTGKDLDNVKTFEKGLHHHGEEMEKPGYTIEELLTLARSLNNQQKARALQIIGNIYSKAHTGMYDFVLEKSLFELWEYMDFVYAIRKGLDEGDKTLINESIHCLANIVYPLEEELCLDIVHSWEYSKPYPWISTKYENVSASLDPGEQESELKDDEMLKMDFLEFFIHRSNLLDRLAYFLKGDCLSEGGVDGILKILIRVARHSPHALVNHEILSIIVTHYTNPNWSQSSDHLPNLCGMPLWMAFKVLRILIESSPSNANKIYQDYNFFPTVLSYLAYDDWKSTSLAKRPEYIVIESFRIWIALISHGIAVQEYASFFPVLMNFFALYQSVDELSQFDLLHSGYVFSLLIAILNMREESLGVEEKNKHSHWVLVKDFVTGVEKIVIKLMTIISSPHLDSSYDEGTLFWSLSRAVLFLTESSKYNENIISDKLVAVTNKFLISQQYSTITSHLRKHSIILSSQDTSSRYPSNFASVNALFFGGNCNPIIVFGTALPLLTSILSLTKCASDGRISMSALMDNNVNNYVKDLLNISQSQLPPSFFIRYELAFILKLVELYPVNSTNRFYLAYRAISETPKCCSRLFNNLFKIALSSSCDQTEMDMCYKIYGGYLLLDETTQNCSSTTIIEQEDGSVPKKKVKFSEETKLNDGENDGTTTLLFEKWSERSIESHWILEPMQRIRTIVGTAPGFLSNNLDEIELQCKICLQLIAKCLQQHCDFIIQKSKDFLEVYCAVCQVFLLGDPRVYIGNISPILVQILQSLLNCNFIKKFKNKPIFSKQKQTPGIPNMFIDFYPDLIKEYSENSYFNEIFASYLMIPLRNPENPRLRSNFWIMETIQFLKISNEKSLIPLNYLTTDIEKDSALLDIYLKLLRSGKITRNHNEFLFEVIKTNLQKPFKMMFQMRN